MRRTWNFFKNFRNLPLILKSLKKWFWIWSLPTIIIWVWGGYLEEPHYVNLSKVSNAKDKSEFMNCILKQNRKGNWVTARTKVQIVCIQGQGSTNRFVWCGAVRIDDFYRLDVHGGWPDRDKYHYAVGFLGVTGETGLRSGLGSLGVKVWLVSKSIDLNWIDFVSKEVVVEVTDVVAGKDIVIGVAKRGTSGVFVILTTNSE